MLHSIHRKNRGIVSYIGIKNQNLTLEVQHTDFAKVDLSISQKLNVSTNAQLYDLNSEEACQ